MASPLRAAGADVLTMELLDITVSGHVAERHRVVMSARLAALAQITQEVCGAAGGTHARVAAA